MSPFYPPSRPRQVDGGIRARTARGSIGSQWWSRRFIDALEELTDRGRLSRGRAYARAGQVTDLTVAPYQVTALVQGSRVSPYQVTIGLEPIDEDTWAAIETELAGQAIFRAKLLAGELPVEIEEVFAGFDAPLFPEDPDELLLECSCPDWGWPCKHAAAALYILAEAFDDDPFLLLAWNGRDRDTLLARLRSQPEEAAGPDAGPLGVRGAPLEECLDAYWTPSARLPLVAERFGPPGPSDLLLRMLDPPAVWIRGESLVDLLRPGYLSLND